MGLFLQLVVCSILLGIVYSEKFTALKDLENILIAEHGIAHDLREYIRNEEARIEQLKVLADDFEAHSEEALENPVHHLGNPVNAFLLVKRFTQDWDHILQTLIKSDTADRFLANVSQKAEYFPDDEDLGGAAQALLRLQDTYQLDTKRIATGDLQGVKMSPTLKAEECFQLGSHSYNQGDYYHTVLWMQQALDTWETEAVKTAKKADILDYLSFATSMQGNPRRALNLTIEWLKLEPDHVRAQNNKKYYEQIITEEEKEKGCKGDEGSLDEFKNKRLYEDDYRSSYEFSTYEALCRGENVVKNPDAHKLACRFKRHHPIFYIRPLREEVMYLDPFVAVYHDLITDAEIAKVKELATPKLHRSGVFTLGESTNIHSRYRTSKSAWLFDSDSPLIRSISQKSGTLANLTLDTVEALQVLNYGIGGHYEPHYDFARPEETTTFTAETGNRIATVIYYMTTVESGGFTVFPEIGVRLQPIKGSCAIWYNLKRNGEGNFATRHAACPVLTGTKWVCNKWFHERGQEFIRPCALSAEE